MTSGLLKSCNAILHLRKVTLKQRLKKMTRMFSCWHCAIWLKRVA